MKLIRFVVLLLILNSISFAQCPWTLPHYEGGWLGSAPLLCEPCSGWEEWWEPPPIDTNKVRCAYYFLFAFFEELLNGDEFTLRLYKPDGTLFKEITFMLVWNPLWQELELFLLYNSGFNILGYFWAFGDDFHCIGIGIYTNTPEMNMTGIWSMEVHYNYELVWIDEVEVVSNEPPTRNDAFESLDEEWNGMTLEKRKKVVKSLRRFNKFTSNHAYLTHPQVRYLIEEAKSSNPNYKDIPTDLVLAMTWVESNTNFLAIGYAGELGLGQERVYDVTTDAKQAFEDLRKSNLTDADFDNFKYNKIGLDERSDPREAIETMLEHIYELTKLSYIQNDPKKIIAGYNWGQGRLKRYLHLLERKDIPESQWVDLLDQIKDWKKWKNKTTKEYILKVMGKLEECQ